MTNRTETPFSPVGSLNYQEILEKAIDLSPNDIVSFLLTELPYMWRDAYLGLTPRLTNIWRLRHGSFEYIYDDYETLEMSGVVPFNPIAEARLVGALGQSKPTKKVRDDYRLKGWIGPTEKMFGQLWDKGHFIANSIGGAVDGLEANVFVQRRDFNRGWSEAGKRYREMERYCMEHPGTFCFSRPLYIDLSARSAFLEFGILKNDRELLVECFDNRSSEPPLSQ